MKTVMEGGRKVIRILVADNQPCILEGLKSYLTATTDYQIVGEARDGASAVRKTLMLLPDVVLMDVSQPQMNGLEALRAIRDGDPSVKMIIFTIQGSENAMRDSLEAGAQGFVLKSTSLSKLIVAIKTVCTGKTYFDPAISKHAFSYYMPDNDDVSRRSRREHRFHRPNMSHNLAEVRRGHHNGAQTRDWSKVIEQAKRYVELNLRPSLLVKEVAAVHQIHPADLAHKFRRAEGMTVKKFIDSQCKKRILKSIANGNCKGCAIAQEFGFKTDQAFYRWVYRVFGIPFRELVAHQRRIGLER